MGMTNKEAIKKRHDEMLRLRVEDGWTLQAIGDVWDISRERVRQIIGPTTKMARAVKEKALMKTLRGNLDKTNDELAEITGLAVGTLTGYKSKYGLRNKIKKTNTGSYLGAIGEEKVIRQLANLGLPVTRKLFGDPYDIAVGEVRIDVKRATKAQSSPSCRCVSPLYRFNVKLGKKRRGATDFYVFLIDNGDEDYFIVPSKDIPTTLNRAAFAWPCANEKEWNKNINWRKYHNRWGYIADAYAGS